MHKSLFLALGSLVLGFTASSALTVKLSLDRGWKFHEGDIPFPEIKGHGNSYNNAKAGKAWGAAAPEYDDSGWRVLDLPHDWAVELPFSDKSIRRLRSSLGPAGPRTLAQARASTDD